MFREYLYRQRYICIINDTKMPGKNSSTLVKNANRSRKGKERKEVYLYSAFIVATTLKALDTFYICKRDAAAPVCLYARGCYASLPMWRLSTAVAD